MFGQQINRIQPLTDPRAYQTYQWLAPKASHFRPATCEEVECQEYLLGFVVTVDEHTELGQKQAHYIRHDRSRRHEEIRTIDSTLTEFIFEPGQTGFGHQHQVQIRPEIFVKKDGDFRGNPTGRKQILSQQDWKDDFGEHLENLADEQEKG